MKGERAFKDKLKGKVEGTIYDKVTDLDPNLEVKESATHLFIKAYVVRHLAKERDLATRKEIEESDIETELKEAGIEPPRPDVLAGREAYEVETLYGEGVSPEKEILRKIKMYEKDREYELNFVLPNLTFLRYLPFLREEREHWKSQNYHINFYTLDLGNDELIPLEDVEDYIGKEIFPFVTRPT